MNTNEADGNGRLTRPTMIRWPLWQADELDREARRLRLSRSAVIRRATEAGIGAVKRLPTPNAGGGQQEAGR